MSLLVIVSPFPPSPPSLDGTAFAQPVHSPATVPGGEPARTAAVRLLLAPAAPLVRNMTRTCLCSFPVKGTQKHFSQTTTKGRKDEDVLRSKGNTLPPIPYTPGLGAWSPSFPVTSPLLRRRREGRSPLESPVLWACPCALKVPSALPHTHSRYWGCIRVLGSCKEPEPAPWVLLAETMGPLVAVCR